MQQILGVAIGIALTCLLLSIIASHVQEVGAAFTARRAATLEEAIVKMLDDPQLFSRFASHPLIQNISYRPPKFLNLKFLSDARPRPVYVASALFSRVLRTVLAESNGMDKTDKTDFPTLIDHMPVCKLKTTLQTLVIGIHDDAAACNDVVEQWYDGTMERVNGLYKRETQWILLALGMILAVACNANLLNITMKLWNSQAARDQVNAVAQMYRCDGDADCSQMRQDYGKARRVIESDLRALPLGYDLHSLKQYWQTFYIVDTAKGEKPFAHAFKVLAHWLVNCFGWLLTAIAVSLGAPFWFDILNKLINLRLNGAKPPTATDVQLAAAAQRKGDQK